MNPVLRVAFRGSILCLLGSGAAGLVYEVVWARYLALLLGHTSYAVVAVLSVFMGGLALGNWWFGRLADRVRSPLAVYAWLEFGIAAYALVFPHYFEWCRGGFAAVARGLEPGGVASVSLKFGFSIVSILLPSVLMGGTLPLLTRLVTRSLGEVRSNVAALYFANSAGAVAGILLADFWWIPSIGLEATVYAGAAMNLGAGLVALGIHRWMSLEVEGVAGAGEGGDGERRSDESFTPEEMRLAVVAIGVSGFVAMLYEVVWMRMLGLVLGSSTHAFSLMLVTFIAGIAAGAGVVSRWRGLRRTLDAFGWAELGLAGTLLLTMGVYGWLPHVFMKVAGLLQRRPEAYPLYEGLQFAVCFAVMFLPAVCLGMTLPLASRVSAAEVRRTGRSVGLVFSVNTVGTVVGTVVTGLVLLPWLGLAGTLAAGVGVNILIGVALLWRHRVRWGWMLAAAPGVVLVAVVAASGLLDPFWRRSLTSGLWRFSAAPSLATYRRFTSAVDQVYYRDGAGATVSVERDVAEGMTNLTLKVNGKPDASTRDDVVTQFLLGHIPMLLRPEARRVLVVGLGSGMTCTAVLRHPTPDGVDVVEISPEVVEAARWFEAFNEGVVGHPQLRVHVDDAKSFLQTAAREYDVIISEPSNPWMAGVAGVFSREYYEQCRGRLRPGGLMVQWVQTYETDDRSLKIVLRTFGSVFPFVSVWRVADGDLALVGAAEQPTLDLAALTRRFQEPAVLADLQRVGVGRLPVLLAREILSPAVTPFVADPATPIHSDYFPVLEYVAQRAFFVRSGALLPDWLDENRSVRPRTLLGRHLRSQSLGEEDYREFFRVRGTNELPGAPVLRSLLRRWQSDFPGSNAWLEASTRLAELALPAEAELQRLSADGARLEAAMEASPGLLRGYVRLLILQYRQTRSAFYVPPAAELERRLTRLLEVDLQHARLYQLYLGELAWDRGDDDRFIELSRRAVERVEAGDAVSPFELDPASAQQMLARLMDTLWSRGAGTEVVAIARQAMSAGLAGPGAGQPDPWLEVMCHRAALAGGETGGGASRP